MKVVLRVAALVLVVFVAANYFGYQQTGHIPWKSWVASFHKKANDLVPEIESSSPKNTVKISKWTDKNGVVHYENRPVDGAKTLEVNPDDNVLPAAPAVNLPESAAESKPKTMNEEMQELREAKQRQMEAIINR